MSNNDTPQPAAKGGFEFEEKPVEVVYHEDDRTENLLRRAAERNAEMPEARRLEIQKEAEREARVFDLMEILSVAQDSAIVRTIAGFWRLLMDVIGAILGHTGQGLMRAGDALGTAQNAVIEVADKTESYVSRFWRRLGGLVLVYAIQTSTDDQAHPGSKAEGLIFRKPRLVWRVDLSHEVGTAVVKPIFVIGRFGCVMVIGRDGDLTKIGKLDASRHITKSGETFRLADSFGNRMTLKPEPSLLLLALHRGDRVSLSEFTLRALSNGQEAERLAQLNDRLRGDRASPPTNENGDRVIPSFVRRKFGRIAVMRSGEDLKRSGKLRIKILHREFGDLFRLADSFGCRLTLPEGAALLLLSFHKQGEVDLAALVTQATHQGANAILQREFSVDLVARLRIESA